jgi:sterol desaturase/sphingolipid hydroxylase (fatty acid hydroxylase superfamily)
MKRSQFMIQDHPELVKYFASKNPGHLFLFVLPLWYLSFKSIAASDVSSGTMFFAFIIGVIYWTFLEYGIHRWIYHTHFKTRLLSYFLGSFHLFHHKEVGDRRVYNSGFLMIYLVTPAVISPFLLVTRDHGILAALILGLSSAYFIYECVHFLIHYKKFQSGYMAYIQSYHFHHHDQAPNKNFGNTSHLWDLLLGTYDERYKTYKMPASSEVSLILSKKGRYAKFKGK